MGKVLNSFKLVFSFCISVMLVGCGGGGVENTTSTTPVVSVPEVTNVIPVVVDSGPTGVQHNVPYVSIKVCEPGNAANCQIVDHIQVDTGSSGLRIMSSAVSSVVRNRFVPVQVNTFPLVECMQYFDGYAWGPIKQADVQIGQYIVPNMEIQILGDSAYGDATVPLACSGAGKADNTVAAIGAKGILGIGNAEFDCGTTCEQHFTNLYYTCPTPSNCQPTMVPKAQQMPNPIALFSKDNNGSVLQLPALTLGVGTNVQGSLIIGIDSETNNTIGNATVLAVNSANFYMTAQMQGSTYTQFAIDSGTSDWIFDDNGAMPKCSNGFYCPFSTQALVAILHDANNSQSATIHFNIVNQSTVYGSNPNATAFDGIGVAANDVLSGMGAHVTFLAGLPFFYGKTVFTAIEGRATSGKTGPFVAFK